MKPLKQHHPQHFLTGVELDSEALLQLLHKASQLKAERAMQYSKPLNGMHLALLFDKPSLRTRFSFSIAMSELGGSVIESLGDTRKAETPEDQINVLAGYCHAVMVRTYEDQTLARMAAAQKIPVINGLTNLHHPCQVMADLLTLYEVFGALRGLTLCYIGDGNNVLHSLLLLAPQLGIHIHYCCPESRGPNLDILTQAQTQNPGKIFSYSDPKQAVKNAHAVYTDVWTSMGFEAKQAEYLFSRLQVNEALMALARPDAVFMHCLPMQRGKEVSDTLPDQACSVIYQQSENRLHVQKAILLNLLGNAS